MSREDRTFVDAHGVTIHYYVWAAGAAGAAGAAAAAGGSAGSAGGSAGAANAKGIVQLAHGVGEYALRYERLATALAAAGWIVWADDHRGHGATGVEQWGAGSAQLGHLGPGGLRATMDAVRDVTALARASAPELPLILLGHSWGSLMAQIIVDDHADDYDGLVLTGTAYRTPGSMNGGDLNKRHAHLGATGFEWLSRDLSVAAAAVADPLMVQASVLKLFGLRDSLRLFGRPTTHPKRDLPLLVMVGDDDPLGGRSSAEKLVEAYRRRSGLSDVELVVYPGARHEVFNEVNRDEVTADLVGWLGARWGAEPGGGGALGGGEPEGR